MAGAFRPMSFCSSTSHHGLNTAWDGDLFNNRRNSSISLEDIAPLSFNKDVTQAILHATNDVNAMPELPDVETFKRYVDRTSLHRRISGVDVRSAYVLKGVSARELMRRLKECRFESSRRHGKHLFVRTDGDLWLRLHFGMTGSLEYLKGQRQGPKDTRVLFCFANHSRLAFRDQRKFGEIGLLKDVDEFLGKRALGPDALEINLSQFKGIFKKHRAAVKTMLLNQK